MKHLRKSIVISAIALVAMNLPTSIFGQTAIGIRGGMSRATIGGEDASEEGVDVDARIGIKLGASATIPIQDKFSLRLGGDYVQKGWSADSEGLSADTSLDYIELSGLGVVNLTPPESAASVYVLAGPAVAFNTKCESSYSGVFLSENETESCGEASKNFDFGITGGIGTEMAISEGMTFSVELLYTLGLLSISEKGDDIEEGSDIDIKNRAIALQVGVGFPIGK